MTGTAVIGRSSTGQGILLREREREIWKLVAESWSSRQIAGRLSLSVKTVEKHRQNLMNRLGIHDVAGLTRRAIAVGLIKVDLIRAADA